MSAKVKTVWSGIDVSKLGSFREALQAQLLGRIWTDEWFKQEILTNPKAVLEREVGITFPVDVEIKALEEKSNTFYFVLPVKPVDEEEILDRWEQIAGWWMLAHSLWWSMSRIDVLKAEAFREALQAMIIGHTWTEESFRQEMLTNPKAALESQVGFKFSPSIEVKSLEETSNVSYLIVPKNPKEQELDDQLEDLSEWWTAAHTLWWWLVWLRVHTPTTKVVKGLLG